MGQLLAWQLEHETFNPLALVLSDGPGTHAQTSTLGYSLF